MVEKSVSVRDHGSTKQGQTYGLRLRVLAYQFSIQVQPARALNHLTSQPLHLHLSDNGLTTINQVPFEIEAFTVSGPLDVPIFSHRTWRADSHIAQFVRKSVS